MDMLEDTFLFNCSDERGSFAFLSRQEYRRIVWSYWRPLCIIPLPTWIWRYWQIRFSLVWVLQRDDVRRLARISFLDLFPGVRNDSSQCIWPRGARTGCQRGCHHQTGVAWWKNRREKDRWDDERPGFTIIRYLTTYTLTYMLSYKIYTATI